MQLLVLAALLCTAPQSDSGYVYKALMLRAAPGHLLDVIEQFQHRMPVYDAAGERPFIMRHRQGDQWDLMLLFPLGTMAEHYSAARTAARNSAAEEAGLPEEQFRSMLAARVAWREELYVAGPPLDVVQPQLEASSLYHIEMFIALPGKYAELLREREMENDYLAALDRPQNLIFTRVAGAAWDMFTLGVYRDFRHYAESENIPEDRQEAAARAAGFEAATRIGTYLRSLMQSHHDTFASAVRQ